MIGVRPQNFSQNTYSLRKKGTEEREQKIVYKKNNYSSEFKQIYSFISVWGKP